jgi:hypothetical protein
MSESMRDLSNGDDEENKHLLEANLEENDEEKNEEEFAPMPTNSGDSKFFEPYFEVYFIEK